MTTTQVYVSDLNLDTLPPCYKYFQHNDQPVDIVTTVTVPVIDFSKLQSDSPEERSHMLQQLAYACKDWGFFTLENHGVSGVLMKELMDLCVKFFGLKDEMKKYETKDVLEPIRCGTSYHPAAEKVHLWRDFLKMIVHPKFNAPENPSEFSHIAREYSEKAREIATILIHAIFETLGMDEEDVKTSTNIEGCNQIMVTNYYPACPQPHLAVGLPPHSDHGLLTLLIHNGVSGFQLFREGNWVNVNTLLPNSILVNVADQMEIITNGRYKSVLHRAMVNAEKMRSSVALLHGPPLDTIVKPCSKIINADDEQLYEELSYRDYLRKQQSSNLHGKSGLNLVRVNKDYTEENETYIS